MTKEYSPNMMYQTHEQIGSQGKKDFQFDEKIEENELEKTTGLAPTYTITGHTTEEILDENKEKTVVEEDKEKTEIDDQKLSNAQQYIAQVLEAQRRYNQFVSKYRQKEDEIQFPKEFMRYADNKCKKCHGRGIMSWTRVVDKDNKSVPVLKDNKYLCEPNFCKCLDESAFEKLENVESSVVEAGKDIADNIEEFGSDFK